MKLKAEIEKLSNDSKNINFPQENIGFHNFKIELKRLLIANFPFRARDDFDYDAYTQTFIWSAVEYIGSLNETSVRTRHQFSIDPRKDLMEEFSRIATDYEAFANNTRTMRQALLKAGGQL